MRVQGEAGKRGKLMVMSQGHALRFLGLSQLVTNKQASGRTKDLLDIELLREAGLLDEA